MADDLRPSSTTDRSHPSARDARGRFVTGNRAAVMTALRAGRANLPEVFRVLEDRTRKFLEGSIADDGGRAEMPTRRLAQHECRAVLQLQILRLNAALETHGLFDRRGRLRVVWLTKLESLMREARAFDASLGLARRPKQVSLNDYLAKTYRGGGSAGNAATGSDDAANAPAT